MKNKPFLLLNNVSKSFPDPNRGENKTVVHAVSFKVNKGESYALIGESGCGKTTLSRTITGLVPLDSGSVIVKGKNINYHSATDRSFLYRHIQMVFQDPYSSLNPRMRVTDMLKEIYIHLLKKPRRDYFFWAAELMDMVGLPHRYLEFYPFQLSGGQRQRVAIARALALQPEMLILDEAVSALDVSVQAQIMQLLLDLKEKLDLTYLFISHDLGVVRSFADRIGIIFKGYLVEESPAEPFFDHPLHPYATELVSVAAEIIPELEPLQEPPDANLNTGCPFLYRCRQSMDKCAVQFPEERYHGKNRKVCCYLYEASSAEE